MVGGHGLAIVSNGAVVVRRGRHARCASCVASTVADGLVLFRGDLHPVLAGRLDRHRDVWTGYLAPTSTYVDAQHPVPPDRPGRAGLMQILGPTPAAKVLVRHPVHGPGGLPRGPSSPPSAGSAVAEVDAGRV